MTKKASWSGGGLWAKQTVPIKTPGGIFRDMTEDEIKAHVKKMKDETDTGIPAQIKAAIPGIVAVSMVTPGFFTVAVREIREIREWSANVNYGINHNVGIKSATRRYQIPQQGNTHSP